MIVLIDVLCIPDVLMVEFLILMKLKSNSNLVYV